MSVPIFAAIGTAFSGVSTALGGGLLGKALTGALLGGAVSSLAGGGFMKGALLGGLGGGLSALGGGLGGAAGGTTAGGLGTLGSTATSTAAQAAAAGTGAATSGLGGMLGDGFLGKIISGAATGYMEGRKIEEMEAQDVRAEERASARYDGAADALGWDDARADDGIDGESSIGRRGLDPGRDEADRQVARAEPASMSRGLEPVANEMQVEAAAPAAVVAETRQAGRSERAAQILARARQGQNGQKRYRYNPDTLRVELA